MCFLEYFCQGLLYLKKLLAWPLQLLGLPGLAWPPHTSKASSYSALDSLYLRVTSGMELKFPVPPSPFPVLHLIFCIVQ